MTDNKPSIDWKENFIVPHWYMYPPKGSYSTDFTDLELFFSDLRELNGKINLYIHIPFCNMKCSFCTLFTTPDKSDASVSTYVDFLLKEFVLLTSIVRTDQLKIKNLYFGGGTPSTLDNENLGKIMDAIISNFTIEDQATLSVEFSPESTTPQIASYWKEKGFNRVSLGVQSFKEELLHSMNRKHSGQECLESIKTLTSAGFDNINVDLIYGHEKQTILDFERDLELAIVSGVNSLTLHPLAYRRRLGYTMTQTPKSTATIDVYHSELLFIKGVEFLTRHGWSFTSAVSFSKNGKGQAIEEAEALGISTVGLGAGSRTYLNHIHTSSISYKGKQVFENTIEGYYKMISEGKFPISSSLKLDEEEILRRKLVLGVVGRGFPSDLLQSLHNVKLKDKIISELENLQQKGLVKLVNSVWQLTTEGQRKAASIGEYLSSEKVKSIIGK